MPVVCKLAVAQGGQVLSHVVLFCRAVQAAGFEHLHGTVLLHTRHIHCCHESTERAGRLFNNALTPSRDPFMSLCVCVCSAGQAAAVCRSVAAAVCIKVCEQLSPFTYGAGGRSVT